jgi:DNA-binding response OmpR family regulator
MEVSEVIRELPSDKAEQFLRFRLSAIDRKKLREIVAARPSTSRRGAKVDNYYTFRYKDLVVSDTNASYKGQPIPLARKQHELLKVFVSRPEVLLSTDDFTDIPEIFNPKKTYNHPHETLSKLISKTHQIVRLAVGECILNKPGEGWYLKIG